tara:strand:+ start:126 stop:254 length:129 start_codon:yes stop_codon:yes gene_type:complete
MLILVDDYDESDLTDELEDDENIESDAAQFCRLMSETGGWNP